MKLNRIQLEGFRGFRDPQDVHVPDGFLVLQGQNGSGKSTICDAIEFCLTGEIAKFRVDAAGRERPKDYYWWRGSGKPNSHFVRLHFTAENGEVFAITRTRDGCDHTAADIQKLLCDEPAPTDPLGILTDTTIIRDDSISALSLDLADTDRYQRVQRALGAVVGRNYSERTKGIISALDSIHKRNADAEEETRHDLSQLVARLAETRSKVAESEAVDSAVTYLQRRYTDAPADAASLNDFVRGKVERAQILLRSRSSARDRFQQLASALGQIESDEFRLQLRSLEKEVVDLEEAASDLADRLADAEKTLLAERQADEFASSFAELLSHGEQIGLQEGHCPLCYSAVRDEQFQAAIAAARARLQERGQKAADAQSRASEARELNFVQVQRLENRRRELESLRSRAGAADRIRDEIAETVEQAQLVVFGTVEISLNNFDQGIEEAREELLSLQQPLRTLDSSTILNEVSELEQRVSFLRNQAEEQSTATAHTKRALALAKGAEHTVTRTTGELLDERLAAISPLLAELFLRLKPHPDWRTIDYRVRGDVRRFLSISVGNDINPQFVFSTGQKRVTGLAFLLSMHLARHWCKWKTLVLDDPVQHVDDYRAMNLVEVMSAIRRDGRQIICAIEDPALADLLCRRLRASSEVGGASVLLEQGPQGRSTIVRQTPVEWSDYRVIDAFRDASATG